MAAGGIIAAVRVAIFCASVRPHAKSIDTNAASIPGHHLHNIQERPAGARVDIGHSDTAWAPEFQPRCRTFFRRYPAATVRPASPWPHRKREIVSTGHRMSQFGLLGKRRFAPFFWTQALGAFNDNAFRNALVMLVAFQMGLDDQTVSLYTNLAPALFIIPFFLFSATAGQLAEKYEKSRIIRYVKLFEIAAMALAAYGFYTHHTSLLLVVLFMMGMHSTMFGPIKYAILPQALQPQELVGGNGLVEMGTQMAMLIGMIAGNSLMLVAGVGPVLASAATIAVAVAGYLASRRIPPAPATAPELKF